MSETQHSIAEWADDTFGPVKSNLSIAARALKEMSELITKLVSDDEHPDAPEELADVEIVLARLWETMSFDRQMMIDYKMKINRAREWTLDGNGHGQHVPDVTLPIIPTRKPHVHVEIEGCHGCGRFPAEHPNDSGCQQWHSGPY